MLCKLMKMFCTVESLITGLVDEFATTLRPHRKKFTLLVVAIQFLLGIPLVTQVGVCPPMSTVRTDNMVLWQGGMYWFQLMDYYSASGATLLTVVFFEIAGLAWVYGYKRLVHNMKDMLGFRPSYYFLFCWILGAPLVVVGIFLFSVVKPDALTYADTYTYPWWGEMLGWGMSMASLLWIPLYAAIFLIRTPGTFTEVRIFLLFLIPLCKDYTNSMSSCSSSCL
ncbi:SLC6A1 [Cordylochernes scorpioides]|uniref:SLC6A1 n=1 Tax=Cordylochernes scorpioides TaxID=51811 RepID=A0ABY6JZ60_9ARAC|nr:SLC6A1 [Cordylochernes scorpioides]